MATRDLRQLVDRGEDVREAVLIERLGDVAARSLEELHAVWCAARAEANLAYDAWRERRDASVYAVYRAAEDRADAAEDALALAAWAERTNVTGRPRRLN